MIRKVKFSNFYSFEKNQKINFLAKKKKTYNYYSSKSGDQISKVSGFIGSNASGKTNIMRFFSFVSYFVCRKVNKNSSTIRDIASRNFFNNNKPSNFYVEFEHDNSIYYYDFIVKKNIILEESLKIKKLQKYSRQYIVFRRKNNVIVELNSNFFKNINKGLLPNIRNDVSFISYIKTLPYDIEVINKVYNYFNNFRTNITERGEINVLPQQIRTFESYRKDNVLRKEVDNFLCNFDLGLDGFDIKKEEDKKTVTLFIKGIHILKGKKRKLAFEYESNGTRSILFSIINILSALNSGGVVIIDEIELGLHPEALNKLIGFFIDNDKNNNAQLFFSSHSLGFMNKLDMHQIYLVDKNESGQSKVTRLNEVNRVRPDENFLSKYMSGAYGAFPKIKV